MSKILLRTNLALFRKFIILKFQIKNMILYKLDLIMMKNLMKAILAYFLKKWMVTCLLFLKINKFKAK